MTKIQSPVSQILDIAVLSRVLTPCDHAIVISICSRMSFYQKYSLGPIEASTFQFQGIRWRILVMSPEFFISWLTLAFLSDSTFKPPPTVDHCTTHPLQWATLELKLHQATRIASSSPPSYGWLLCCCGHFKTTDQTSICAPSIHPTVQFSSPVIKYHVPIWLSS